MKLTIYENQRGFLFKNGKYIKLLDAGTYHLSKAYEVEITSLEHPIEVNACGLEALLSDPKVAEQTSVVEVEDQQIALHYVNQRFNGVLRQGKHAFWAVEDKHTFKLVDISSPEIGENVPKHILRRIAESVRTEVEVDDYQKALLFFDKKLVRVLEPGVYYFWRNDVCIDVKYANTRLTQLEVRGQEIMTQDKVALRINFVCNYRVTDYVRALTEIDNYVEQLYMTAQLALRDYVGGQKLDDILANKDEMSTYVFERMKAKEKELFVTVSDAGIKDIILPGEIREIMNTVLLAEKRAQANVITRREEVASTRSLLNTAKLMDENKTLYRLKELEHIEKICENVGNINLNGNGDVLSQLSSVLRGN